MTETGVDLLPAIPTSLLPVPTVIAAAGDEASDHFLDFFAANIRNPNTRAAYVPPAQFFGWRSIRNLGLRDIRPLHVAAYIETKLKAMRPPSVKQHLAALRVLFNWLVIKHVVPTKSGWRESAPVCGFTKRAARKSLSGCTVRRRISWTLTSLRRASPNRERRCFSRSIRYIA